MGPDGTHVVDRWRDPAARHAEKDLVHRETLRRVVWAVARLSEQERRVLDHRFGLRGQSPLTLRETGEQLCLSRERVRQLEAQAIARLKRRLEHRYPRLHVAPARPPAPGLTV